LLRNCYRNSLRLAVKNNADSIAFPNISTGIFKFPKDKACTTAVDEVLTFLKENETISNVLFVCYDEESYKLYVEILKDI
jgi:O-acetyl-ADP-ribose deacetylase (regulator of RNase III)